MRKKHTPIEAWKIYFWLDGDVFWGATPLITRDGIQEIYRENCKFIPGDKKSQFKAEVQVKKQLSNTMNAINWYGKKVLDSKGNVDLEKFIECEIEAAVTSGGIQVDIETMKPIKKFKTERITHREAKEYNFA